MKIPEIAIGILSSKEIHFQLNIPYRLRGTDKVFAGKGKAIFSPANEIILFFDREKVTLNGNVYLEPLDSQSANFDLFDVVIGINFHWERKEDQRFKGILKFITENGAITAINILPVEDYLESVISSEMSATSSLELLKAHAVISRSWLLAQKQKSQQLDQHSDTYQSIHETEDEYVRWYDREDHEHFDVCADDHCQRYQGITKVSTPLVKQAIQETFGELLMFGDEICDARFSKCCGGVTEKFENNWEPVSHPYLVKLIDNDFQPVDYELDLTSETRAKKWIEENPPAFCNTTDKNVLVQVLNDYDQETPDFYRWKVEFTQSQISDLIHRKTGWDFGQIINLIPIERGESARLIRLKIVGTKLTKIIGKELYIRKALSESHLYSSAFIIEKEFGESEIPEKFILKGAGWGHGVGLCQIGAAVMGSKGYDYKQILTHYFPETSLIRKWKIK